jgi:uncharacterized protein YbjT (DUF2867 family)
VCEFYYFRIGCSAVYQPGSALAKKIKLSQVVYHSVFRVEHFKDVPHFASKLAIESVLREFDVPFIVLRPNYFTGCGRSRLLGKRPGQQPSGAKAQPLVLFGLRHD